MGLFSFLLYLNQLRLPIKSRREENSTGFYTTKWSFWGLNALIMWKLNLLHMMKFTVSELLKEQRRWDPPGQGPVQLAVSDPASAGGLN